MSEKDAIRKERGSEEVRITDEETGGQKGMKPERMDLLPYESLRLIARTYHYGATKYDDPEVGPYNWRRGYSWSLSFAALQRHLAAFWDGQDRDDESGELHLAHAGWHVLSLLWYAQHRPTFDDRPHTYFREPSQNGKDRTPGGYGHPMSPHRRFHPEK